MFFTMAAAQGAMKLTRTISTKVTEAEDERIRAHARAHGCEVSALVRETLLAQLEGQALRSSADMLLELFALTMEASLERGEGFTVEHFRELCREVHAGRWNGTPHEARRALVSHS